MDNELFKQKLSQVADWKIPDTQRETTVNAKKKRGRKNAEELYQEAREEMFHEEFGGVNPTYPPMLLKVKTQSTLCSDCGCQCNQGRKKDLRIYKNKGRRYWKEHCLTCDKHKDPYTGQYTLTGTEASIKWNSFCKEVKGAYKSKGTEQRELVEIRINPEKPYQI